MKKKKKKAPNMEQNIVTSNFSFSHYVFHSYKSLVCQNAVLCGNGLKLFNALKTAT